MQITVTNDTLSDVSGKVVVCLRNSSGQILQRYEEDIVVQKLNTISLKEIDHNETDYFNNFVSYEFIVENNIISSGTTLFTNPKIQN